MRAGHFQRGWDQGPEARLYLLHRQYVRVRVDEFLEPFLLMVPAPQIDPLKGRLAA